jgi:hypothetical protein
MNILEKIVTPGFIAFQAHCWFAYAVCYTFNYSFVPISVIAAAGIKEFYIDKHFEVGQSFKDNLTDFSGYLTGVLLALFMLALR